MWGEAGRKSKPSRSGDVTLGLSAKGLWVLDHLSVDWKGVEDGRQKQPREETQAGGPRRKQSRMCMEVGGGPSGVHDLRGPSSSSSPTGSAEGTGPPGISGHTWLL